MNISDVRKLKLGDVYYEKHTVVGISKRTNTVEETQVEIVDVIPQKWILTSERLPNKGQWVLVTTGERQKPYEVMCYQGIRIGEHDDGNGWEEYEYPSWTSGHGDVQGHHPEAWMMPSLPAPYES